MYKLLRDIHLALGLFSMVFLIAYALSAAQMAYPIYRPGPQYKTHEISIPEAVDKTPRPLAKWLMDNEDLRGDLRSVSTTSLAVTLKIVRPATIHDVLYDRATKKAKVVTARQNFIGMLNRLHHTGGLWHDHWAINAWGGFLALVSIFLIVIALTGVYMWFKRNRDRRIGAIVFTVGLTWGLTLLVLIRAA